MKKYSLSAVKSLHNRASNKRVPLCAFRISTTMPLSFEKVPWAMSNADVVDKGTVQKEVGSFKDQVGADPVIKDRD